MTCCEALKLSDTAKVVLTRIGEEHIDLPTDVLTVNYTNNSEDYEDFLAGSHYLELGFVNEYEQIKSAIWCPGTGQNGFESLDRILSGEVNPSGKTAYTIVTDLTQAPTFLNSGKFAYDNMEEFTAGVIDVSDCSHSSLYFACSTRDCT